MLEYAWIKIVGGLALLWIVYNIRQDLFGKNIFTFFLTLFVASLFYQVIKFKTNNSNDLKRK